MERFPWHLRLRHAVVSRPVVSAAVTVVALAVVAAAGMARERSLGHAERLSGRQEHEARPDRSSHTARAAADRAFDVLSGPINKRTDTFTLKVRIGSTCSRDIIGASVYVTAVPYNQFSIPEEELTGNDGNATLVFRRDANFPASDLQQQLTLFIRATKPGEDPLAGISTRRLVAVPF